MLLQITILSQSQRSWPVCRSEICSFLTTIQQFNLVFNKEVNFIRKKQSYFREYGRPWQQKLSTFITRPVSLSLLGGLPVCIVAPFSFPANKLSFSPGPSRKWPPRTTEPQNHIASQIPGHQLPCSSVSNLNSQKRYFWFAQLVLNVHSSPVGYGERWLGSHIITWLLGLIPLGIKLS